jgi:hypothetical protein
MATARIADACTETQPWYGKKWTGVAAVVLGSAAAVIATVVAAGTQIASSPTAGANTISATPWTPRPTGAPVPQKPDATVGNQGNLGGNPNSGAGGGAATGWASKAGPPLHDIQAAMQSLTTAIKAQDFDGLRTACGQLGNAGQRLGATLPSPDQELTSEIQAAVDDVATASNSCPAFGPGSGQAELSSLTSPLNEAMAHLSKAQQIASGKPGS